MHAVQLDLYHTSTRAISVLVRLLCRRGESRESISAAIGANLQGCENDPHFRLELGAYLQLWKLATERSGDPALGLHLHSMYQSGEMHIAAQILMRCANGLEAVSQLTRYVPLVCPADEMRVRETTAGRDSSIEIGYSHVSARFQNRWTPEHYASIASARLAQFTGRPVYPVEASFQYPDPGYGEEYRRILNCPVRFEQPECVLVYRRADLLLPFRTQDLYLQRFLAGHANHLLQEALQPASTAARVQRIILRLLPRGTACRDEVARELGISERTMLRRLKQEGVTYRALVLEIRRRLALRYLSEELTVAETAHLLGFSESSSFANAFREWFACTPARMRRRLRGQAGPYPPEDVRTDWLPSPVQDRQAALP